METLLSSPTSRLEIVVGKFVVVILAGLSIFWCVKWFNREGTLFRS
ncbi:MAG: hypothetical protein CMF77_03800 [Candidatus Marinimicrobia bacterium]|nr:hypothetical protein [Candidatus Neomarinimicrobiota bacterium]